MLTTAVRKNKYPSFDLAEIVAERDLTIKPYRALQPVKAGNYLPDIELLAGHANWQHFFGGAETHGANLLRQLLSKPLVISFYSPQWQQHGLEQLKQLNALQADIKANGGNLLVITTTKGAELEKLVWDNSFTLNFYFDPENRIAKSLRIYDDASPAWYNFSGIDINVPLPVTYLLDTNRQVIYTDADPNLNKVFSARELLSALQHAGVVGNLKRSA